MNIRVFSRGAFSEEVNVCRHTYTFWRLIVADIPTPFGVEYSRAGNLFIQQQKPTTVNSCGIFVTCYRNNNWHDTVVVPHSKSGVVPMSSLSGVG